LRPFKRWWSNNIESISAGEGIRDRPAVGLENGKKIIQKIKPKPATPPHFERFHSKIKVEECFQ
jgi:hypothetical protein